MTISWGKEIKIWTIHKILSGSYKALEDNLFGIEGVLTCTKLTRFYLRFKYLEESREVGFIFLTRTSCLGS